MNTSESPSAICPICTAPVPNNASYCMRCGTELSRCPICAAPVLTGPTSCPVCGAQLSLPRRKPPVSDPSMSMRLPDATVLFEPQKKVQDEVASPLQELPQPVAAKPRNEMLAAASASALPSHEAAFEANQEQTIGQMRSSSRMGQRFGNYQLIRFLGEGGFAEVYLGEHIHLGSQAAIKVLHGQLTSKEINLFRAEARTLVRLIHPHIVRVLDFGIEGKTPFLVMDYAPNGTLRQLHPRGKSLPLATINLYVKQIAEALQSAHDEKIIHRDIKPENMLVGPRHDILLSDFGIAMMVQSSRYQNAQDMAGTIAYMAPEQIHAHPRPASDQYSLGIVVYEWLCGQRPFQGSFKEIAVKHVVVPPPSLLERMPTLPAAVEEVVLKALAKNPKDRFGSVWEFACALEQAR